MTASNITHYRHAPTPSEPALCGLMVPVLSTPDPGQVDCPACSRIITAGYKGARYLRDTPFKTVTEWRRATIAAIPERDRCTACEGSGADVLLASNGGVGEVVNCWPCGGTGRRRAAA